MYRTTIANLRAHISRLVAVSAAIALAVAFVAATFILNDSFKKTLASTIGADYAASDLVIAPDSTDQTFEVTQRQIEQLRGVDGVADVDGGRSESVQLSAGDSSTPATLQELPPQDMRVQPLTDGQWPSVGEIVVDSGSADRYHLSIGDSVTVQSASGGTADVRLSGIVEQSNQPGSSGSIQAFASPGLIQTLSGGSTSWSAADLKVLATNDGAGALSQLSTRLTDALGTAGLGDAGLHVRTVDEQVNVAVARFSGDTDALTGMLMAFVAIAFVVCALVIANTFSVIVAQRTRELALLRCLGASRGQVRGSVVAEAAITGLVASIVGVLFAVLVMNGVVWYTQNSGDGTGGLTEAVVTPATVLFSIITGVVVTLVAAFAPAGQATRVSPLAALQPVDASGKVKSGGKVRAVIGLFLLAAGIAGQVFAVWYINAGDLDETRLMSALAAGVLGCLVTVVAVVMLAVFIVPPVIRWVGALLGRGVPARLAVLNSVRNPGRTGATAGALIIGVALVSTVYTGAVTARGTINDVLDQQFPVDMMVLATPGVEGAPTTQEASQRQVDELRQVDGIADVVTMPLVQGANTANDGQPVSITAIASDDWAKVGRAPITQPDDDTVVVPANSTIDALELKAADGSSIPLTVSKQDNPLVNGGLGYQVSQATLQRIVDAGAATPITGNLDIPAGVLAKFDAGLSEQRQNEVREQADGIFTGSQVLSLTFMRQAYDQVINVLLLIVTALLAVSVVIAVIGVSNTLSLSVIERTRENALLRALGLTKGQLRSMLSLEAVLVSVVATIIGIGLGVAFGWVGCTVLFSGLVDGGISWSLPWSTFAVMLVIAVLIGLGASLVPSRRAAKLSPVQGLATV